MITLARLVEAAKRDLAPYWPVPLPRVELAGVHLSELEDLTKFFYGGELLLTVRFQLTGLDGDPVKRRLRTMCNAWWKVAWLLWVLAGFRACHGAGRTECRLC
jgi:hypothetical protein